MINNMFAKPTSTTDKTLKSAIEAGGAVSFDNFDMFMKGPPNSNENTAAFPQKTSTKNKPAQNSKEKKLFNGGETEDLLEL